MSAFVVEDKTINGVISFVSRHDECDDIRRTIKEETGINLLERDGPMKLGTAMFALNCNAIEQRYGKGEAANFRDLDYSFRFSAVSRMQAYKNLRCWRYQCCEGDVPETSLLYTTMNRVLDLLAHAIVADLPEFSALPWG